MNFFEKFRGFDDEIAKNFLSLSLWTVTRVLMLLYPLEASPLKYPLNSSVGSLPFLLGCLVVKMRNQLARLLRRNFSKIMKPLLKTKMELGGLAYHIPRMKLDTK